jgi:hypothetical protein
MTAIGRLFLILLGCLAASLAAAAVLTVAVAMSAWSGLDLDMLDDGVFGHAVAFVALFLSLFAALPVLAVIVVAEAFAIRSVLYYAATGAAVTSLLYFSATGWSTLALAVDGFARRELEIIAAAGIVAGLVYWAIAGRHAGRWGVSSGGRTGA